MTTVALPPPLSGPGLHDPMAPPGRGSMGLLRWETNRGQGSGKGSSVHPHSPVWKTLGRTVDHMCIKCSGTSSTRITDPR
jgi:hypothetical protein